jgi:hypothetical protein
MVSNTELTVSVISSLALGNIVALVIRSYTDGSAISNKDIGWALIGSGFGGILAGVACVVLAGRYRKFNYEEM